MAFLPRPVTIVMLRMEEFTASSITYWMSGLSTSGSISLGCAFVAGRNRVPNPAAGNTALEIRIFIQPLCRFGTNGSDRRNAWLQWHTHRAIRGMFFLQERTDHFRTTSKRTEVCRLFRPR